MGPEGWFKDPAGVHRERWMSDGKLTSLVRDDGVESRDDPPAGLIPVGAASSVARQASAAAGTRGLPPPVIRSGIDPPGLRSAADMVRFGVHYWRAAVLVPAVTAVLLLWLGPEVEWQPYYWAVVFIGLMLTAMHVVTVLRQRRLSRDVLRSAALRGEADIVIPRLFTAREGLGAAVALTVWAAFGLLLAVQ